MKCPVRGFLLAVLGLLAASGLEGQRLPPGTPPEGRLPGGSPALQPNLEIAAGRFARAWAAADAEGIGTLLASGSVSLHLDDVSHGSLSPRQAVAALQGFLQGRETRKIRVVRTSEVGGSPSRGFAEVAWQAVAVGTVEDLTYTVYVGFVLEEGWKVTEVRVME